MPDPSTAYCDQPIMLAVVTPKGVGHHTCHHLYRLVGQPEPQGQPCRLPAITKFGLPQNVWTVIAARVAAGESLRSLGREYGVSQECIRRVANAATHTTPVS